MNIYLKLLLQKHFSAQNAPNSVWRPGSARTRWESLQRSPRVTHSWIKVWYQTESNLAYRIVSFVCYFKSMNYFTRRPWPTLLHSLCLLSRHYRPMEPEKIESGSGDWRPSWSATEWAFCKICHWRHGGPHGQWPTRPFTLNLPLSVKCRIDLETMMYPVHMTGKNLQITFEKFYTVDSDLSGIIYNLIHLVV